MLKSTDFILAKQIIEMARVDQLTRKKAEKGMKQDIGNLLVFAIDGVNNQYIKNIIADYGYPKKKNNRGSRNACILAPRATSGF